MSKYLGYQSGSQCTCGGVLECVGWIMHVGFVTLINFDSSVQSFFVFLVPSVGMIGFRLL